MHEYGITETELDDEQALWLLNSYVRRKKWESKLLAIEIVKAQNGISDDAAGKPHRSKPKRHGQQISPDALMRVMGGM